jgi:hypothetical protein
MAMPGLGPVVTALWRELGLAPPVEMIGSEFEFDLGSTAFRLELEANGDTVTVRGRIGWLEGNAHEAGDQLGRVLKLGLGLTALNGAVLDASQAEDILERDHQGPVPVFALALAALSEPASILPAVRAVLDWQTATESILSQSDDGDAPARSRPATGSDAEMIIFQP